VHSLQTGAVTLFVNATSVTTGQPRLFIGPELSIDALLASACLPQLFQAVEIDGEPYWDGGYSGNPALWPLIYHTPSLDLLLVRINPLVRAGIPNTAMEILDCVNEITFNAGLAGEMRAIGFVTRLLQQQKLDAAQ
jgi:NTE family protein